MATHRIPILGHATIPDESGSVFPEPYDIKASNDVWKFLVWIFNDTDTRIGLRGHFDVPQNYVDTAQIVIIWTSTATSGDVEWDFDYRAVGDDDAESLDQAGTQESVNSNDTAPSAAHERNVLAINLTSGNLAAGDTVEFELFRDGTDGGDTMSAAAILIGAYFQYADA